MSELEQTQADRSGCHAQQVFESCVTFHTEHARLAPLAVRGTRPLLSPAGLRALAALGLGVLLTGCAVGPNYHRPDVTVPAKWETPSGAATQPSVAVAQPIELAQWWRSFNDPTLEALVRQAVESSLDLRQAQARIRQARAARGVAAGGLWPHVDVNGSYRRSFNSGASRDLFQVGFDALWELDFFGGVRRNIEASEADIQAAVEDRRDVMVTLISEVAVNYTNLRGFQQQIAIARQNLSAQQHSTELTRQRVEVGVASRLDVVNAEAQAATTESEIPLLEASAQQAIYNLGLLVGREPGALLQALTTPKPIPTVPPEVPVGLPSDLLRRRPDIRRAEAQLHAATARVGVATADLFPRFSLTGSLGLASTQLTSLTNWNNRFWSIGPTVSWPIFDAGSIRSNIQAQNAIQEETLLAYRKTILAALQEVESALVAYAKEQEHRQALQRAVEANRQAVELATKLYTSGRVDFLNVLSAQRSLYASEDALAQSNRVVASNLIALYKALAGGWE